MNNIKISKLPVFIPISSNETVSKMPTHILPQHYLEPEIARQKEI